MRRCMTLLRNGATGSSLSSGVSSTALAAGSGPEAGLELRAEVAPLAGMETGTDAAVNSVGGAIGCTLGLLCSVLTTGGPSNVGWGVSVAPSISGGYCTG